MILLTGATGMAGAHIAREFARERVPVRMLVRDRAKLAALQSIPAIHVVEGDMAKAHSMGAALDGVDRVLMISSSLMDMVDTQCRFIDACKAAGVRHVIKFSGLDARRETVFPFGLMHRQIEEYLEGSGMAWTHLRPTGFMQEYLREAPSIARDGAMYLALDGTRLNPVNLVDVGRIAFRLLRDGGHEGARLPVTGPELLSMTEIAGHISEAIGKPIRYVPVSRDARREALIARGIPPMLAEALDRQVEERLKGGLESRVDLRTHQLFQVAPTTFLEFAKRNAVAFAEAAPNNS
jgi:uncharacterized protein YbjT (DUF2867 family)